MKCNEARSLIKRAFVTSQADPMPRDHLADCESCRDFRDGLFEAELALGDEERRDDVLSETEKSMLFGSVHTSVTPRKRRWLWVPIAVAAGATASLVAVITSVDPRGGMKARGTDANPLPVTIRPVCISDSLEVRPAGDVAGSCATNEALGFVYSVTDGTWYLELAAVEPGEAPRTLSIHEIQPTAGEEPLDLRVPLAELGGGEVTIHARFSRGPPASPLTTDIARGNPQRTDEHWLRLTVQIADAPRGAK